MQIEVLDGAWKLIADNGDVISKGVAADDEAAVEAGKEFALGRTYLPRKVVAPTIVHVDLDALEAEAKAEPAVAEAETKAARRADLERGLKSNEAAAEDRRALIVQFQSDLDVILADSERIRTELAS